MPTIGDIFGTWEEEQRMVENRARVAAAEPLPAGASSPAVRRHQVDFQDAWVGVNAFEPWSPRGMDARRRYRDALELLAAQGAPALPAEGLTHLERSRILNRYGLPMVTGSQRDDGIDDGGGDI